MAKMTKAETQAIDVLNRVAPKVTMIAVNSPDPLFNYYMLDLDKVCYITTRNAMPSKDETPEKTKPSKKKKNNKDTDLDSDKETSGEIVFICDDGKEYSNYSSLKDIETELEINKGNVWFMRTSNSHIINIKKLESIKINNARDLTFKGIKEPVINCVTRTYLEKFKQCPMFL